MESKTGVVQRNPAESSGATQAESTNTQSLIDPRFVPKDLPQRRPGTEK